MGKRLYVGNLPYSVRDSELYEMFLSFGKVVSANVLMEKTERDSDSYGSSAPARSKGFGFVEMEQDSEADAAMDELNGKDYNGRPLIVNEARPPQKNTQRRSYDRSDSGYESSGSNR